MEGAGFGGGLRASVPVFLPTLAIGVTFGLLAEPVIGAAAAVCMSMVVWSGTAQFAALSVITAGGGWALSAGTGLLANARYLPMGFGIAPSLRAPRWRRALTGVLLADASFAIAHDRSGGGFDSGRLEGAAPLQYVGWVVGSAAGVAGAAILSDPTELGLDVWFPVFYLGLLLPELDDVLPVLVALLAAGITLLLTPVAPPGVPILAGVAAALLGLRTRP